jgi:DNA-binding response OmpR family regulator
MRAVLVIEEDTLIRELMREHLEREGYTTCAVATVRIALEASRWTRFELVLLDCASAQVCASEQLAALRALGSPVVMMSTAPRGSIVPTAGEIEQVVWSPFDLATLTGAVHRFLPPDGPRDLAADVGPVVSWSGTFRSTQAICDNGISTLPPPADADRDAEPDLRTERLSLEALGALVLEATGDRR